MHVARDGFILNLSSTGSEFKPRRLNVMSIQKLCPASLTVHEENAQRDDLIDFGLQCGVNLVHRLFLHL